MKRERISRQYIGKQEVIVVRRAIEPKGAQVDGKPAGASKARRRFGSGLLGEIAATLAYSGRFPAEWWRV